MKSKSNSPKKPAKDKHNHNSLNTSQKNSRVKKKWYQKTIWILLLLILFFPVGLYLMIKYARWNKIVKTVLGAITGFWFIIAALAMSSTAPEQISLSADASQLYDINTKVEISLETLPKDYNLPKYAFKVSDGELIFEDDKISFTSSSEGEFDIYAEYSGVSSNKITLGFEDVKKKQEEAEAERLAAEQEEAERIAVEQAEAERIAAEQAEAARIAAEQAESQRIAQEQAAAEAAAAQQQNSGSNFNTYDNPEQQQTMSSYVLNTSTMKFHYPTCRDVKKIAPQNYSTYDGTRDGIMNQGYSSCGHCHP